MLSCIAACIIICNMSGSQCMHRYTVWKLSKMTNDASVQEDQMDELDRPSINVR